MDYLDPDERRRHVIVLYVGYVLIGLIVLIITMALLYLANGFGFGKNGQIIQNGLVFVSSTPGSANVYLNGKLNSTTNSRIILQAGTYNMKIKKSGYRTWQKTVSIGGGSVLRVQYPFLIPSVLSTKDMWDYKTPPGLVTQSVDNRWLLAEQPGSLTNFQLFDLRKPTQSSTTITVPSTILSPGAKQSWKVVEWANDNSHVLLKHFYGKNYEYILLNTQSPSQSVNLNSSLGINPTQLTLSNGNYNQYFVYKSKGGLLQTDQLSSPSLQPLLTGVISYKTYDNNTVLYVTSAGAKSKTVNVDLLMGGKTYNIRTLPAKTKYLLNFTQYSENWYVAIGVKSLGKIYIYKNPNSQLDNYPNQPPIPISTLKIKSVNYLSFSDNARFILAENGTHFGIYDAEYNRSFVYLMKDPLQKPQAHAEWMDGNHLDYVSKNKLIMFDFDHTNRQVLVSDSPRYGGFFGPSYQYLYTIYKNGAKGTAAYSLGRTALQTGLAP